MGRIRKCVIPAAGIGKRFYPLTRAQPKEMLPILDKPVIHYVVEEAVNSGLDEILIIVGAGKDSIINYFDKHNLDESMDDYGFKHIPDIYFVRQKEQRGLADAIRYGNHFTGDEDFVVLLGDTIYRSGNSKTVTSQILDVFQRIRKPLVAVEKVPMEKIPDYGIVDPIDVDMDPFRIRGVVEKPEAKDAPSNFGITGIYILGNYIYDTIPKIKAGKNGELQLSDAYNIITEEQDVYATKINGERFDIGTMDLWIKTFVDFAKRRGIS
ncbi:MAG: UTP--glucose-1-phosphate uridylyltransferase [Thermoplasmataceae archaeon]